MTRIPSDARHFLFDPLDIFGHVAGQETRPVGADFKHLVHHRIEKVAVVADEDDGPLELPDGVLQDLLASAGRGDWSVRRE
jgi:hypothetical protein